jgi:hypothetical protein
MDYRNYCDNQGCRKEMRPVVDKTTLIAYCTECGKPVNNISPFMRRQMAANGQVQRDEKKKLPWAIKCSIKECGKEGPPNLTKDNKLVCSFCGQECTSLAKPFAEMIKVNLKAQRRADGK